jgi:glycosyltransferase involved in cell wall biosynthesis
MDNNLPYSEVSIFAVPADITACGKLRVIYPTEYLRRGGANISCKPMLREMDIVRYPVILLQRQVSEDAYKTVKRAVDRGQIVVYELDDDLWNIDEDSPARRVYYPGSDALKWSEKIVSACTGVFASTTNLGKKLSRFNPNVHVIENSLDLQLGIRDWATVEYRKTDKLVVGWTGGITHQVDIPHIARIANALLEKYPDIIFALGGPEIFYQDILGKHGVPEDRTIFIPPREFDEYPGMYGHFDVSICPLHDTEFNRSKSFLKVLEAGAWGVPSVCAPVQPYFEFDRRHGGMIAIADTIDDWVREVGKLIEDENLRKQKGSQLKSLVWWDYNLETNHRKWLDGFNIIYDRSIKGETFNPYDPGPNDPCWCGSGRKFKKCHRK